MLDEIVRWINNSQDCQIYVKAGKVKKIEERKFAGKIDQVYKGNAFKWRARTLISLKQVT